jgi:hypothetical protein
MTIYHDKIELVDYTFIRYRCSSISKKLYFVIEDVFYTYAIYFIWQKSCTFPNKKKQCPIPYKCIINQFNFIMIDSLQILFRFRFVVFRFISLCFVSHVTGTPSVLMTVLSESMDRSQIRVYYPLLLQSIIYSEAEKEGPFKRHICIYLYAESNIIFVNLILLFNIPQCNKICKLRNETEYVN